RACRGSAPPRRRRPPACSVAELLFDLAAEEIDERRQVVVGGEAGGALVAASPLLAGDRGDVHVPLGGAQARLAGGAAAIAEVADHGGDLDPLDRAQVVDHTLGHLLASAGLLVVGGGDVADSEP